jgi:hypothetical protein
MLHTVVPATLEHRHRALQVAVDVGERRFDAVAHAGLRAEMDHALGLLVREHLGDAVAIGEVELHELEFRVRLEQAQARVLQRDVVVRIEVVEPDDLVTALEQKFRSMEAYEPGCARDKYSQVGPR